MGTFILIVIAIAVLVQLPPALGFLIFVVALIVLDRKKFGVNGKTLLGSVIMYQIRMVMFIFSLYTIAGSVLYFIEEYNSASFSKFIDSFVLGILR